jgi:PIN domain nuclease of toxin-antitoxin system
MDRRYLLDTNIVLYFLANQKELNRSVKEILTDYNNLFYVSSISVQEMVHLFSIGKIKTVKWKSAADILQAIKEVNFELLPVKWEHLAAYAGLSTLAGHNDPNDHVIIAQAIAEQITLISSDHEFEPYTKQKLRFIFNDR